MNAQTFPTFDGTFVRTAPDNPDGSHNIAGYIFRFDGHGSFDPAGRLDGVTPDQEKAHNDNLAAADLKATAERGQGLFYLTGNEREGYKVSQWTGAWKVGATVYKGRHNIARVQRAVYFTGPDGKPWYGRQYGDNGQSFMGRRLK